MHGDDAAPAAVGQRYTVAGGQRIARLYGGHAGGFADPVHGHPAVLQRQAADAQVGRAGQHRMHHLLGRCAADLDMPAEFGIIGQGRRQQPGRQRRGGSQAQRPRLAARDFLGARADLAQADQGVFDVLIEQEALLGGRYARPRAGEQRIADLRFQVLDEPADGRLGAAQQLARCGDAARRHDGGKGFELSEFHLLPA
ncbi:hypothetical protein L665_02811 [Ralstonia solanacearum SD54]|nr:hypothetical protein L665_02811 [Ralstonia solanacearum SD54]